MSPSCHLDIIEDHIQICLVRPGGRAVFQIPEHKFILPGRLKIHHNELKLMDQDFKQR